MWTKRTEDPKGASAHGMWWDEVDPLLVCLP